MKILFLNHNIKGRGTYVRCFQFAKNLVKFGNEVTILTSTPKYIFWPKKEIIEGVEIITMPDILSMRFRNGGLGPIDTLLRCLYLFTIKFDIVENFDHRPNVIFPALICKFVLKYPLVSEWTDLHGNGGSLSNRPEYLQKIIGPYENYTEAKSKKLPDKLIVISNYLGLKALKLGVPKENIEWIPGGSDIEKIKPIEKSNVRAKFNLPQNANLVGFTGYSHYDMDMVLQAVSIMQEKRPDVVFVTTGARIPVSIKKTLFSKDRVIELGYLESSDYEKFLPSIDVFLFPFVNKEINLGRWPNKIGDYMAAGRPIVTNKTGDIIKLFEEHKIGLFASESPEDISEKVLTLLEDKKLSDKLGKNARRAAEKYFDWGLLAKKLETNYLDLLSIK